MAYCYSAHRLRLDKLSFGGITWLCWGCRLAGICWRLGVSPLWKSYMEKIQIAVCTFCAPFQETGFSEIQLVSLYWTSRWHRHRRRFIREFSFSFVSSRELSTSLAHPFCCTLPSAECNHHFDGANIVNAYCTTGEKHIDMGESMEETKNAAWVSAQMKVVQ